MDNTHLRGGRGTHGGLGPRADQDPQRPPRADLRHRLHRRRPGQLCAAVRDRTDTLPALPAVRYLELAGDAANGVVWSTTIGILPDAIGDSFKDIYRAKYNSEPGLSQSGCQFDIIQMWARTANQTTDPYDFATVNKLLKEAIYRGTCGTYLFVPEQLSVPPYPDQVNDPSLAMAHLTYQIQDLQQVCVSPNPYDSAGTFQLPPWLA